MNNKNIILELIKELRNEFHIPLFCDDNTLENLIKESHHELLRYVNDIDYINDLTARMLIKNCTFYAFNNIVQEFHVNYKDTLLSWQMSKVG